MTNYSITGFIIGLILIAMTIGYFGIIMTNIGANYNLPTTQNFTALQESNRILTNLTNIKQSSELSQSPVDPSAYDILGQYFSTGYQALKVSLSSFSIFENIVSQSSTEVPGLAYFAPYIISIFLAMVFIGIFLAVIIKWNT